MEGGEENKERLGKERLRRSRKIYTEISLVLRASNAKV